MINDNPQWSAKLQTRNRGRLGGDAGDIIALISMYIR
jgi:hypothetical protein